MIKATSFTPRPGAPLAARRLLVSALAALLAASPIRAQSSLAVEHNGERTTWWRSSAAPAQWTGGHPAVTGAIRWTRPRPGLQLGELDLHVNHGLLRLRVIVVRLALADYDVALQLLTERGRGAWAVDSAPPGAALALNAGQFTEAAPWGWVHAGGHALQYPGSGPLAIGLGFSGRGLEWLAPGDLPARYASPGWQAGFQSYPLLLRAGEVPLPLRVASNDLDLEHRDIRLAFGAAGDTVLIALTRFAGAGAWLARLPAGLTVPESAALMGALGARDAVMLDGGLSAQLLVRDRNGRSFAWRGSRRVPLGLVFTERRR